MKKTALLLTICSLFVSCYTYNTYDPEKDGAPVLQQQNFEISKSTSLRSQLQRKNTEEALPEVKKDPVSKKALTPSVEPIVSVDGQITTKSIIQEKGYYQVEVFDKTYKIEAVKWEGDTLVAHKKGNPGKTYKFNEKDIQNLKVRKFSKGRSDALTVSAYALLGVVVYLILK